jgi:hypothetical protein
MAAVELNQLKPIKFVMFPNVEYDPDFGSTDDKSVDEDHLWKKAAASIVHDPEDTRAERLELLKATINSVSFSPFLSHVTLVTRVTRVTRITRVTLNL